MRGRSIVATGSTVVAAERAPSVALLRVGWAGAWIEDSGPAACSRVPAAASDAAVLTQPDGRILVAGRAYSDASQDPSDWTLLRYGRSGALDRSFGGGDGIVVTDFGTAEDSARALAFHDGRILAAGFIYSSQGLARYLP